MRYSANRDCPVFEELASILRKTSGLVDVLAAALSPVKNRIILAFVFGSLARGGAIYPDARSGAAFAASCRTHPFIPTWQAEIIAYPQLPTTPPTLDELLNRDGITPDNIAQHILQLTENPSASGHVFTLHAELEGGKLLPVFEQLLQGWQTQGYELVSLQQYLQGLEAGALPRHEVVMREVEGRTGTLAVADEATRASG